MTDTPVRLLDLLPDAVVALDDRLQITAVNTAACRLTGYSADQLIGSACGPTLEPHDRDGNPLWPQDWGRSARLRSVRGLAEQIITVRRGDGRRVAVALTGTFQRDPAGAISEVVLCLRDAVRHSQSAVSGIEMISTVGHELRAPLTSVKGYSGLLLNRWDRLQDDQKQMMLRQIIHDADRVTRLITELLDISRLEAGRLVLRRQLVDLPRLAATVAEKVRLGYPNLEAETTFPENFPKVYADPDKLEQVLSNLLENACKYGSPLGLLIEGAVDYDQRAISVAVRDQGEGIAPSDLPKVFTKYFRRAGGRPTGSGLGLWISRGLIESHGGQLSAESNIGTGSIFRFTLPLVDLDRLQES